MAIKTQGALTFDSETETVQSVAGEAQTVQMCTIGVTEDRQQNRVSGSDERISETSHSHLLCTAMPCEMAEDAGPLDHIAVPTPCST